MKVLPAQNHAIYTEAKIGRDGAGAVNGGLAFRLETVVHLDTEYRVDDYFQQAEPHGL